MSDEERWQEAAENGVGAWRAVPAMAMGVAAMFILNPSETLADMRHNAEQSRHG